jgi:hypothetical protein
LEKKRMWTSGGLLYPKEKKIFGLYENGHFCPTILRKKRKQWKFKEEALCHNL